ncbi:hypothetical protein IGS68_10525 [Skermanella sp. TT6]|uniref:TolB-like protein n=1 Tax=Skermanella cutis TaxID=2775420 RepID=A0ABX7BEB9_9PROT|nr:hypothetical protein [Skermanella sp. TT6]QQP91608.1 hypothetical protein IGS68_10525 [Skermanella sp. TT6]
MAPTGEPTDGEILDHLDAICATEAFRRATRCRNFLRYVVEETLAGRTDRIKAYAIAVSVLGRDESFDPQADPVVRIEAGHLRRRLEHYYLTDGSACTVRIELPKGSYVPVFVRIAPPVEERRPPPAFGRRRTALGGTVLALGLLALLGGDTGGGVPVRTVQVNAFVPLDGMGADMASGLQDELKRTLTGNPYLLVVDERHAPGAPGADLILEGSVRVVDGRIRVNARMMETRTARYIWAEGFDVSPGEMPLLDHQARVAEAIAQRACRSFGH